MVSMLRRSWWFGRCYGWAVVSILFLLACGDTPPPTRPVDPPPDTTPTFDPPPDPVGSAATLSVAFTGVDVVTMNGDEILADQTVVVSDGLIVDMGPSTTVTVPDSVAQVDGAGLFLMPGLADMHTHLSVISSFGQTPDPLSAEQQGILLVANGVTTVMNMGDYERHDLIALRDKWLRNEAVGPTMLVGKFIRGPQDKGTNNDIASSVGDARRLISRAWSLDYDFVKVYSRLSSPVRTAALAEAAARGLPVFGHLPLTGSTANALGSGQRMVAHIAQYFSTHYGGQTNASLTPGAISITNNNRVWVTPTLVASESFRAAWGNNQGEYNGLLQRPGVPFTHPEILQRWQFWLGLGTQPNQLDFQMPFLREMTRDFLDGGVELLLGTDAPELPGLPSGFAVHTELESLVRAGLSDHEALGLGTEAAGRFVSEFFPNRVPFGTVEVGMRADLILVRSNPLAGVAAANDRVGVMARGVWYTQTELDVMLDELRVLYGN